MKKKFFNKNWAFTLAEVLIILGIIGVVAAITLPVLIQNYKRHEVETKLQKFYSLMNQAAKQSELTYGEFQYWNNSTLREDVDGIETWWNTYFAPYVKTLKTEKEGLGLWVYLTDGTAFYIFNYYGESATTSSSTHLYFYPKALNSLKLGTGTMGKDFFTFFINANTNKTLAIVEPYKFDWNGDIQKLTDGEYGCRKVNEGEKHTPHYCTALIEANGWKIPKNYPFRF